MELLKKYSKQELLQFNPLTLAFVGDAVFSLHIREFVISKKQMNANMLTRECNKIVNAGSQYKIYRKIEPLLTEEELSICHRARNANIHSKAKNYSVTEYIYATAFEALLGYLYLQDDIARLNQILQICKEDI